MSQNLFRSALFLTALLAFAVGCATTANTPAPTSPTPALPTLASPTTASPATSAPTNAPANTNPAPATNAPSPTDAGTGTTPTTAASGAGDTVTLVVVPAKSKAQYRVREQLAGVNLPSDAVGSTNAISGTIVGKTDGTIVSDASKIVVDVRTLQSDQGMRDGFIQRTPLQTSQYPYVTFVPTSAPGIVPAVPSSPVSFQLQGNLTVRDVTKPVNWNATCQATSQTEGTCTANTSFTFEDFSLEQPRVGRVLSIDDKITLEVEFALQRVNP